MGIAEFTRARDIVLAAERDEGSSNQVCEAVLRAFHQIARFDWAAVLTVDPETLLPTAGVVEGFSPEYCAPFWDTELVDPDFDKFAQLARSAQPIATLHESVDGDLERSPRYCKLYSSLDAADELRVAFVAGRTCLANAVFVRAGTDGPFAASELADVRELVPVATTVLRRAAGRITHAATAEPPVVIILDAAGEISSISAGGERLLDELRAKGLQEQGLPAMVRAAATRARWSRNSSSLATRVQGTDGRWLRMHVTPMSDEGGSVAVTIEPARPSDLVPIMLESYGLTERETEVVLLLARGLSAKEIAEELVISSHTVRDHIRAVYDKAGVNNRGELVAQLFSHHLLPEFHASVDHVGAQTSAGR